MQIQRTLWLASLIMMISLIGANDLAGQTTNNVGASRAIEAQKTIGFRQPNWQKKHIHNVAEADKLIASLKKIGCEVIKNDHNGHLDISFRCEAWKTITVQNEAFQKQWSTWLGQNGLETVVIDPPTEDGLEIVKFRKPEWKSAHVHEPGKAAQMISMLKMIGCESDQHEHNGHIDVRYQCPEWKTIALHNHQAADTWQQWLNSLGFETEHSH